MLKDIEVKIKVDTSELDAAREKLKELKAIEETFEKCGDVGKDETPTKIEQVVIELDATKSDLIWLEHRIGELESRITNRPNKGDWG